MKATFHIHYRTVWGEELKVVLPDKNVNLCTTDGYLWAGEAELPDSRLPRRVLACPRIHYTCTPGKRVGLV